MTSFICVGVLRVSIFLSGSGSSVRENCHRNPFKSGGSNCVPGEGMGVSDRLLLV